MIILTAALYLGALAFFVKGKHQWSLLLLLAASFFARFEMASLDPYLHNWDERFHALVSKHMTETPFRPVLFKHPALPYDHTLWCCNHVWVHKQPLFLWQMALSMKIFGVNEIAMRLPSVVMGMLMVFFTYKIAWRVSRNTKTAFIASFLFSLSWYQLELTSGLISLDHNDIAFAFYILGSIWAYSHYLEKRNWKWILITGLFSGAAVLCKWLVGWLVFSGWGISVLLDPSQRRSVYSYLHMLYAFFVSIAVFLPWQLYIIKAFPKESAWEYQYNNRHLFEVLEGHFHEWWFYFSMMRLHYGKFFIPFMAAGILLMALQKAERTLRLSLLISFAVAYLFFTIVPTKLQSFTFIVAPIGFILIAYSFNWIWEKARGFSRYAAYPAMALLVFLGLYCLKPWNIYNERKPANWEREAKLHNTAVFKNLPDSIQGKNTVIMNCPELQNIELMFYKEVTAYTGLLEAHHLDSLHQAGYRIWTFPAYGNEQLPEFVTKRKFLRILPAQLK